MVVWLLPTILIYYFIDWKFLNLSKDGLLAAEHLWVPPKHFKVTVLWRDATSGQWNGSNFWSLEPRLNLYFSSRFWKPSVNSWKVDWTLEGGDSSNLFPQSLLISSEPVLVGRLCSSWLDVTPSSSFSLGVASENSIWTFGKKKM